MKLTAFTGPARSGKDKSAEYLIKEHGFQKLSFAQPIKDMLRAGFDLSDYHLEGEGKDIILPQYGKSPRQMMQTLGTEWGRGQVNEDIWLINMNERIENCLAHGMDKIVITDCRFDNEAEMVRELGGVVVHISRDHIADEIAEHSSEGGVVYELGDRSLWNNGTVEDLHMVVRLFAELDGMIES